MCHFACLCVFARRQDRRAKSYVYTERFFGFARNDPAMAGLGLFYEIINNDRSFYLNVILA
jgi:hypothetical protein